MELLNTVEQKVLADGSKGLPVRTFTIEILTNPPVFMVELGLAKVERKTVQIQGYSLKDAKKRAGIE
jgi:hypothetical protein